MDHTNEPTNQVHSDSGFPSLADKMSALERRMAEQQDQLRDYEKSLVERIADVDDDRRTTAAKLQRAWQTRRKEINDRLGRQTAIMMGSLIFFLIVLGAVLFLAYRQVALEQQSLAKDLAELKQEVDRMSGKPAEGDVLEYELTQISAAINEISSSLGQLDEKQAGSLETALAGERSARDEADALIGAEVRRVEVEQQSLLRELKSLREALEAMRAIEATPSPGGGTPERSAKPGTTEEPAAAIFEPPLEPSGARFPNRPSPPDETTVAVSEQPVGNTERGADEESSASTRETVVVGDRAYALQLIGFFDREALLKFTARDDLPERMYYREEIYRGRPWFVLIHSVHEDYASAALELHQLSPELIEMDPWIRPIRESVELKELQTGAPR